MNTWKVILATLVIFIAGIFTGASLVRFVQGGGKNWRNRPPQISNSQSEPDRPGQMPRGENPNARNNPDMPNPPGQQPGLLGREFIVGLDRQLHLSPDQRDKIEKLMMSGQQHIREIRSKVDPEMRKEMQTVNDQIKALLTIEQREQFDRMMKQRLQRRPEQPNSLDRRFREPREGQGDFRGPRNSQPAPPPLPPEGEPPPQNP